MISLGSLGFPCLLVGKSRLWSFLSSSWGLADIQASGACTKPYSQSWPLGEECSLTLLGKWMLLSSKHFAGIVLLSLQRGLGIHLASCRLLRPEDNDMLWISRVWWEWGGGLAWVFHGVPYGRVAVPNDNFWVGSECDTAALSLLVIFIYFQLYLSFVKFSCLLGWIHWFS